jgi:hypothetical protein
MHRVVTKDDDMTVTATTCRSFILDTAKKLDHAFGYLDLSDRFDYGTLRNTVSKLRREDTILKLPEENPARFILPSWKSRPEYKAVFQNDNTPMGGRVKVNRRELRFDFAAFVASLGWGELAYVHDVRLEFDVVHACGVCSDSGWVWSSRSHGWLRRFEGLEFPLCVQVFDTGRVQVLVRCSFRPVPFDFGGLTRLTSVLGELKGKLGWDNVPNVAEWVVTSWHYGKDSVKEVSGASFNVTFETWFKTFARIYVKSRLRKVRVEETQSPDRRVQDLFESVINRGEAFEGGRGKEH